MDIRTIKALANIVRDMGLGSLEVEEGDFKVKIEGAKQYVQSIESASAAPAIVPVQKDAKQSTPEDAGMDFNAISTVVSPMVGVFYASPAPEKPAFVSVGSKVKKGDVLCIVEAMKLMNEIIAEQDGEIVDICARNGDVVEYGQTLFKIF